MKVTLFFSLLPFLATAANPPACLLQAVNTSEDPSDLGSICASRGAPSIQQAIFKLCASGTAESVAQSAFVATCSSAGSSVAKFTASSTKSSHSVDSGSSKFSSGTFVYTTAVYNSDCSCTTTVVTSATAASAASTGGISASSATATATDSQSAAASSAAAATGAANANTNTLKEMSGLAAAMVAAVGVLVAL
ncbi:hypothetical protein DV736_g5823, partial [Chaetothyriales sp. CBS 134916]